VPLAFLSLAVALILVDRAEGSEREEEWRALMLSSSTERKKNRLAIFFVAFMIYCRVSDFSLLFLVRFLVQKLKNKKMATMTITRMKK
jgi:hypothetical protein